MAYLYHLYLYHENEKFKKKWLVLIIIDEEVKEEQISDKN